MVTFDVLVIGAGISGLTAARSLRRRNSRLRIAILEQFATPAPRQASSHGHVRITRSAYPSVHAVRGMFQALSEWRILEQELGTPLIHNQSMCLYGTPDGAIQNYAAAIEEVQRDMPELAVTRIDVTDARRKYPQFRLNTDSVVLDDRTAGTLFAGETIRRLLIWLAEQHVEIRCNTTVADIDRANGHYRIRISDSELTARHLVIAAGPWVGQLVNCPPGRVTPIRQTVAYVNVQGLATGTSLGEFPTWAHIGQGENAIHYGLPACGGQALKVARHVTTGPASVLSDSSTTPDPELVSPLVDFVREHFAVSDVQLVDAEHCMYTCGAADRFIVDWLDESHHGVVLGAGSGHMFKWAPFLGEVVADMLTEGQPRNITAKSLLLDWSLNPG